MGGATSPTPAASPSARSEGPPATAPGSHAKSGAPPESRRESVLRCGPPMAKTAGILLIGNEILSGKINDANAAHLWRELRALGVEVRRLTVIPDEVDLIA